MKVYVSAFSIWEAKYVANYLRASGHEVVSSWHEAGERPATEEGWTELLAKRNIPEIESADVLVLVASRNEVPGGKHVEAGIALGGKKRVIILGDRENRLYWHPLVSMAKSTEELKLALKK